MARQKVEREKIVVWPSLRAAWWVALLPLPPLGFALWMAVEGRFGIALIFAGAFVLLSGLAGLLLSRRGTSLELRADGIEMRVMGRRWPRYRWADIEGFARVSGKGGASVGWLLCPGAPGRRDETGRRLAGADVSLPSYFAGDTAALERLLAEARASALAGRWSEFLAAERATAG